MLQRLSITLSQVKAGKTYKNLLNENKQIMYSLHTYLHTYLYSIKFSQTLAFTKHRKTKSYKNNKFKISAPPWNEE